MEEINESRRVVEFSSLYDQPTSSLPRRRHRSLSPSFLARNSPPRPLQSPPPGPTRPLDNRIDTQISAEHNYPFSSRNQHITMLVGPSSAIPQLPFLNAPSVPSRYRDFLPHNTNENFDYNGPQYASTQQARTGSVNAQPYTRSSFATSQEDQVYRTAPSTTIVANNYQQQFPALYSQNDSSHPHSHRLTTTQHPYAMAQYPPQSPHHPAQNSPSLLPQSYGIPPPVIPGGTWWYFPNTVTPYAMGSQVMTSTQGPYSSPEFPGNYEPSVPFSVLRLPDQQVSPVLAQRSPPTRSSWTEPLPAGPTTFHTRSTSQQTSPKVSHSARRSHHPAPPPNRSEWVMWVGNVPPDASRRELWEFFHQPDGGHVNEPTGVQSIYLLSRSCCAFVNFGSEIHLQAAISRFQGEPLRPADPSCPGLVCRPRRSDDELQTGVGKQRGIGIHLKWIHDQQRRSRKEDFSRPRVPNLADRAATSGSYSNNTSSLSSGADIPAGSPASTTSSLLATYFPYRYFILKSKNQRSLDLSREENMWTTQKHNQEILDKAYRTSELVYLIFGVNKTGEFYGYARMAGPINLAQQQRRTALETYTLLPRNGQRPGSGGDRPSMYQTTPAGSMSPFELIENSSSPTSTLSAKPGTMVGSPLTPGTAIPPRRQSFNDVLQDQRRKFAPYPPEHNPTPPLAPPRSPSVALHLGSNATAVAIGTRATHGSVSSSDSVGSGVEDQNEDTSFENPLQDGVGGIPFKLEWICTTRLSFELTRHLRNPWNANREIKISRDGIELEPHIGKLLLETWGEAADPAGGS